MIKIEHLNVQYGGKDKKFTAIDDINLDIAKGEICSIIGPSGGGKSTLLKVLAGIIKDYKGQILIEGENINPKIHRIGFIPQNYGLVEWKTVEENILLSAKIKYGKRNIDKEYYEEILNKLKIDNLKNRYPKELSGGQKQRVSIARAFLLKPNLLLMDESFSALDAMTREKVQELFLEVWREHKVTTVLITHDIKEAIYLGEKLVVFSSSPGRIIKIIRNPLFGESDSESSEDFRKLSNELIRILKEVNTNEIKGI
ncbi:ABC transporter ATP-binding protein [Maledivibacter halophilus]|uniref:NitT/TauT family transport system ATP-binding protein n=1 Tax=Maledivibacter halophilus TaxID=36842 RepID=A0A1T5IRD3_9FIRM|nr:ABC transporter ATP-binding protein [Maledivibacter halophilus]SKC41696.1 NitT/TauT family transport system ATP-binding protein [Maledivibacter halophilus]